ncbi:MULTISPECIES: hypothetical protein [unclassified Leptolyngbya]|uniref:hypothetical protein n=1 Tax=unclassified Leptolyngbya TaxID=2650499 RepID=UPI003D31EA50
MIRTVATNLVSAMSACSFQGTGRTVALIAFEGDYRFGGTPSTIQQWLNRRGNIIRGRCRSA